MNDTTEVGTVPVMHDVRDYVTAVRSWLADLPADEVEDLTAGMEADLAERAAETGERLGILLGEPETYAAELRSAAGLPPRAMQVATARGPGTLRQAMSSARADGDRVLLRWPWLRELRPTWWLARGAVLGWLVAGLLGTGRTVLLPAIGAALSMWLGQAVRRRERLSSTAGVGMAALNVLAAVALLPMLSSYSSGYPADEVEQGMPAYPPQVTANGEDATNLYAYDAAGNRLDGVRLFDQAGRRVYVNIDNLLNGAFQDLPTRPEDGMPDVAADVFPLTWPGHDAWAESWFGWTPPLVLSPVPGYSGSTPAPDAGSSATMSPSPTPSPSPSASSTP